MRHLYQNADKTELIVIDDEGRHTFYPRVATIYGNIGEGTESGGGSSDEPEEVVEPKKKRGPKPKGRRCGNCGEVGHRKETCTKGKEDTSTFEGDPISQSQHADILTAREHDMTSSEIAKEMDIPVQEVNLVMAHGTYKEYLAKRPK